MQQEATQYKRRCALVVIDMINDFVHGNPPNLRPVTNKNQVINNAQQAVEGARRYGIPIVFVSDRFQPHEMTTSVEYKVWGEHAIVGTSGAEVIDELRPRTPDFRIPKKRYSGFAGTNLDLVLRELRIDEMVALGVHTDCCVQHTVWDAFARTYATIVLANACGAPETADHERALRYMKTYYATRIMSVEKWIGTHVESQRT